MPAMRAPVEGGESHFRVKIAADAFAGKMLVQRHRLVNEALAEELAGPVHAAGDQGAGAG